jgi:hypothetical protein
MSDPALTPYRDSVDHLRAELARLDVLLRLRLEEWWAEMDDTHEGLQSLYVSDAEVDGLLDVRFVERNGTSDGAGAGTGDRGGVDTSDGGGVGTDEGFGTEAESPHLARALARATDDLRRRRRLVSATGDPLRFHLLCDRFDLDRVAADLLLVALAPELDRKYERIYGYLQDDVTRRRPTVDFALGVLASAHDDPDPLRARALLGPESPLVRGRLVSLQPGSDRPLPSRTLHADERVTGFVLGSDAVDGRLDAVETRRPTRTLDDLVLDDAPRRRLARLASTDWEAGADHPLAVVFTGPDGVGRDAAVEALCVGCSELLVADVRAAGQPDATWVDLLVREARLRDVPLSVRGVTTGDDDSDADVAALLKRLDAFEGPLFLSGTAAFSARMRDALATHAPVVVDLPRPGYDVQRRYWETFDLPDGVDPAVLASTFSLTPGTVDAVVRAARREAQVSDTPLSKELLYRCCRAQTTDLLGTLARAVTPTYGWEDIVLPPARLAHLREVAAHVKHRGTVYTEWGFESKFSLGNGLVVLFTGPSGTGKTMAAEIIAGDAGLDLYKIDLSSVVSKYIGETERNLGRVFDEAEGANVVLLFDEADALFGKRSEVSDAHDRYANIEVNYLLQRIEEHDGTVILTTNFKRNIDDAFLRRIHLSVDFPMPDERSRAAIWESIFPSETPCEKLDVEFLAGFELSGGNIKNVALTGAFLAADAGEPVGMAHVVRALGRELEKMGRVVRPDEFGRYQGWVST